MFRAATLAIATALTITGTGASLRAEPHNGTTLVVTMTNDPKANAVHVYDAQNHALLQTLTTQGKGGASGNARGVKQHRGEIVAVVNNGSDTVALFRRDGDGLAFDRLVTTTSAPVSIDFGNDHMYVAGETTVDSFELRGDQVGVRDGSALLELSGGGLPAAGSTAQVGVLSEKTILVTLKTDPMPGTVDVVSLQAGGAVSGAAPTAVSAPDQTLTPFGFSVYPDGTAVITLAHSSEDGLFRDGAFVSVNNAGQTAPCWTTRVGKYVFTANTGSQTISRLIGTGNHVFVDSAIAAPIVTGGAPSDIDADWHTLAVLDHVSGVSHVSLFSEDRFGELTANGTPIEDAAANANGIAVVPPVSRRTAE